MITKQQEIYHEEMSITERRAAGFVYYKECPFPTKEQIEAAYKRLAKSDESILLIDFSVSLS